MKAIAGVLIALVVCVILAKQNKDFTILVTISVCCMLAVVAIGYLTPVIEFFSRLESLGGLNPDLISVILKAVGIALLGEITCNICADTGNGALGKTLQILASAVILWMSLPLFTRLIELVENLLESV